MSLDPDEVDLSRSDEGFLGVLRSAAKLQQVVPDAVLVGESAAALYANHRVSFDHDHVVADLRDRFEMVLEALEAEPAWITNRVTPGKIILGQIGDIEAGVRQLIRRRPLETQAVSLPGGETVTVPTAAETLRIKAYLAVKRNQTRDYLDIAALSDRMGVEEAASVLAEIDNYYADETSDGPVVSSQMLRQLGNPRPVDSSTTKKLHNYKKLNTRWTDWSEVVGQCVRIATRMLDAVGRRGDA